LLYPSRFTGAIIMPLNDPNLSPAVTADNYFGGNTNNERVHARVAAEKEAHLRPASDKAAERREPLVPTADTAVVPVPVAGVIPAAPIPPPVPTGPQTPPIGVDPGSQFPGTPGAIPPPPPPPPPVYKG
jgi:hypothetical protein